MTRIFKCKTYYQAYSHDINLCYTLSQIVYVCELGDLFRDSGALRRRENVADPEERHVKLTCQE